MVATVILWKISLLVDTHCDRREKSSVYITFSKYLFQILQSNAAMRSLGICVVSLFVFVATFKAIEGEESHQIMVVPCSQFSTAASLSQAMNAPRTRPWMTRPGWTLILCIRAAIRVPCHSPLGIDSLAHLELVCRLPAFRWTAAAPTHPAGWRANILLWEKALCRGKCVITGAASAASGTTTSRFASVLEDSSFTNWANRRTVVCDTVAPNRAWFQVKYE